MRMTSGPDPRVTTLISFDANARAAATGVWFCVAELQALRASAEGRIRIQRRVVISRAPDEVAGILVEAARDCKLEVPLLEPRRVEHTRRSHRRIGLTWLGKIARELEASVHGGRRHDGNIHTTPYAQRRWHSRR